MDGTDAPIVSWTHRDRRPLMGYASIFGRGFLIVALTAANIRQIAGGHYLSAFVVGFGISLVWWFNSRSAAHSELTGAGWVYALGAGIGTLTGMYLAGMSL